MGCFLACFGSSKDGKRAKQGGRVKVRVQPRDQTSSASQTAKLVISPQRDVPFKPTNFVPEISEKPEEQLSGSDRKRVTFDSNVEIYEHVSPEEEPEDVVEGQDVSKPENQSNVSKVEQSESSNEDGSVTTSVGTYPPNYRYQNSRDSDDEYGEWVDSGESDLDDEGQDSNGICDDDDDRDDDNDTDGDDDEIDQTNYSPIPAGHKSKLVERSSGQPNHNGHNRSAYIPPVLKPVENLTQWKAVKVKGTHMPLPRHHKENFATDLETRISSSNEQAFKQTSFQFMEKVKEPENSTQEVRVDASLSTWLISSETMSTSIGSTAELDGGVSEKSVSMGSTSPRFLEDRPILGALTVEELRKFSPKSSPRKSPSRSPDEMPLIGTVGTYWGHREPENDSHSASFCKGIPNTTSKYREDNKVNWHSTPFETRLERALALDKCAG